MARAVLSVDMHIVSAMYVLLAFWYGVSTITLLRQGWDASPHSRQRAGVGASGRHAV